MLRLLSQAYLLSGQAANAYACVEIVRKLQNDDDRSLGLTAIEALIQEWVQLGNLEAKAKLETAAATYFD